MDRFGRATDDRPNTYLNLLVYRTRPLVAFPEPSRHLAPHKQALQELYLERTTYP